MIQGKRNAQSDVDILSISDHHCGGAAIAAGRLNTVLAHELGLNIVRISGYPDPTGDCQVFPSNLLVERLAQSLPAFLASLFRLLNVHSGFMSLLRCENPRLIHFHNLHGLPGWSVGMIGLALRKSPVVWVLHDQWALTGTKVYNLPEKCINASGELIFREHEEHQRLPKNLCKLAEMFSSRLRFVCPSRWLAEKALSAGLPVSTVHHVPNSLDLSVFFPSQQKKTVQALRIPQSDLPTALMVSVDTKEPRKGGLLLEQALEEVNQPLRVLVAGSAPLGNNNPKIEWVHLGPFRDPEDLVPAYRAADFLIHPALIDNLPNVVLESLACGTPVVAFKTGGLPEMVLPGQTGWLADPISVPSLNRTILEAISDVRTQTFRHSCRQFAETHFSPQRQAQAFAEIHHELCMP